MIEKKKLILNNALKCKNLITLDKKTFLKAWKAIFFLFGWLHPDEFDNPDGGWPERLKPLAKEAFRRFQFGEFSEENLYQAGEAMKGLNATVKIQ